MDKELTKNKVVSLMGNDRNLTYLTTVSNPFGQNNENIDIYADDRDFEYWFKSDSGELIQASPRAGLNSKEPIQLNFGEIRNKAIELVVACTPNVTRESLSKLHPYEENRRGKLFLFRWEGDVKESFDIPPFVQIGLYSDGSVACYTNNLI